MNVRWTTALLALFVTVAFAGAARADGIDGKWKSTFKRQDGTEMSTTYAFKADGEKLTGTVTSSRANATPVDIKDGTIKNGEITFTVERERNGNKMTTTYKAKLDGDTLKGTSKGSGNNAQEREFTATREK